MAMDSVMRSVLEGARIPKKEIEATIERYRRLAAEFEEKGLSQHVERLEESILRLEAYKGRKQTHKPRAKSDIQMDIDYCLQMKHQCLAARRPVTAAVWAHKLTEYEEEYRSALVGKVYIPQVEDRKQEGENV